MEVGPFLLKGTGEGPLKSLLMVLYYQIQRRHITGQSPRGGSRIVSMVGKTGKGNQPVLPDGKRTVSIGLMGGLVRLPVPR